jgi:hypothetical protein
MDDAPKPQEIQNLASQVRERFARQKRPTQTPVGGRRERPDRGGCSPIARAIRRILA